MSSPKGDEVKQLELNLEESDPEWEEFLREVEKIEKEKEDGHFTNVRKIMSEG